MRDEVELVAWPLSGASAPDLGIAGRLAGYQLAARHAGCEIRLRDATPALRDLLDLVGLADVIRLEVIREPKGGEQRGIDEVVMPDDQPA